jgi:hypothetical protein
MIDERDIREMLERRAGTISATPTDEPKAIRRARRRLGLNAVVAGLAGLSVIAGAVAGVRTIQAARIPAGPTATQLLGRWFSTDTDGSIQTMTVRTAGETAIEIVVHDDVASVCSGAPSTMTGTGGLGDAGDLVIPTPVLTCDDGSEPEALSGPPLEEQLRNLTFVLDAETGTLTDNLGGVWLREGSEDPLADREPLWPQTSLEEVRQAQERADVGDPRYTWQVHPDLEWQVGQHHPDHAEIFVRFLKEKLGWEEFLWDEAFAHPDGLNPGDVVYVRCAPGRANPLYPTDSGCAPTIDELRYETVKINVAQLDRQGPSGIWVVTGWEMIEPAAQADPRVVEAEATALLEAFLQARIDGQGAEGLTDLPEDDPFADVRVDQRIPLLYATSTGVPYERSELELVDGPVWPRGGMQFEVRLFAENGETVMEQFFSLERDATNRLRLVYDFEGGPAGPGTGTTENGKAVPEEYSFLDGKVTYRAAYPAAPWSDLWNQSPEVATVVGHHDRQEGLFRRLLLILADPRPIGPGCEDAPAPADAEALARSIRSDRDLEASAAVAVTIGGTPALQIDVMLAPGASFCSWSEGEKSGMSPILLRHAPFAEGDRARLYLLDLPGGSARVLALAIIADEDSFERALELAAPIVDSIEFHTA